MNLHQTFVILTRDFGRIFPTPQDCTFSDAAAVMHECELSWYNHGHTENPFTVEDARYSVWEIHAEQLAARVMGLEVTCV